MAMYYYARKLQKGASTSSSTSSSSLDRHSKSPPTMNINGAIPCCSSSQCNGPIRLPPPPPCVMMGVNGGLVTGGNYRFQPQHHQHHHHPQQSFPHPHHHYHQQHHPCHPSQQQQQHHSRYHLFNGPCCCGAFGGRNTSSGTNTPNHNRRLPPLPPVVAMQQTVEEALLYNEDCDNDSEIPIPCKVHNSSENTSFSHNRRSSVSTPGTHAASSTCATGYSRAPSGRASSQSPFFDDNLSSEENKDLIFNGPHLISGSWEALVKLLLPTEAHFPDEDYIFTFLLSARLYVQPHELLGRIFREVIDVSAGSTTENSPSRSRSTSPQPTCTSATSSAGVASVVGATFTTATGLTDFSEMSEDDVDLPLDVIPLLVKFLRPWTELFPYDFRDDRMMAHVRILAHKCVASDEEVREQVSQLLAALLARLAALEKYEEFLHRVTTESSIGEPIAAPSVVTICPDPATMAEQLTLVELQRFSFIGSDEFIQTLGKEDLKTGVRHCDCVNRKTKNLEAYVMWFQRLTYYVASEICKMSKKKSRCRVCEYWIQVAKECLNIRNFNSLMAILAGLNIQPVARLKRTWSKPLYNELAEVEKAVDPRQNYAPYRKLYKAAVWQSTSSMTASTSGDNQTYRILVPYFSLLMKDIYNLDSVHPSRLPNGHIDFEKCRQLAKLVTEITSWQKVQCDFVQIQSIFNSVQASPIFSEQELIYASYLCEQPETSREKEQFKKLHRQNFQVPLIAPNSSSENDT